MTRMHRTCAVLLLVIPVILTKFVSARHGHRGKSTEEVQPHKELTEKISSGKVKNGGRNGPAAENMPFPFWLPMPLVPWDAPWGQPVEKSSKRKGNTNRAKQERLRDKETKVHGEKNVSGLGKQQGNLSSRVESETHSRLKSKRRGNKGDRDRRDAEQTLSPEEENIKDQWLTTNLDSLWIPGFENVHFIDSDSNAEMQEGMEKWSEGKGKYRRDIDQVRDPTDTLVDNNWMTENQDQNANQDVTVAEYADSDVGDVEHDESQRILFKDATLIRRSDPDRELEINTRDVADEPESYEAALQKLHDVSTASSALTAIEKKMGIDPATLVDTTHQRVNSLQSDLRMYSKSIRDHIEHVHEVESSQNSMAKNTTDVGALKRQLHHEQEMVDLIQTEMKQIRDIELMATGLEVAKYVAQVHAQHRIQEAASRRHLDKITKTSSVEPSAVLNYVSPTSYQSIPPSILQANAQPLSSPVVVAYSTPDSSQVHGANYQTWTTPVVYSPAFAQWALPSEASNPIARHENAAQRHKSVTTDDRQTAWALRDQSGPGVSYFTSNRLRQSSSNPPTHSKVNTDTHYDQEQDHFGTTWFPGTTYSPPPSWMHEQQNKVKPDTSQNPFVYNPAQANTNKLYTSAPYPGQTTAAFKYNQAAAESYATQTAADNTGDSIGRSGPSPARETSYHPPLTPLAYGQQPYGPLTVVGPSNMAYSSLPQQTLAPLGAALPLDMSHKSKFLAAQQQRLEHQYFFPKVPYSDQNYRQLYNSPYPPNSIPQVNRAYSFTKLPSYFFPASSVQISRSPAASLFSSMPNAPPASWAGLHSQQIGPPIPVMQPALIQPAVLYPSPVVGVQSFASPQLRPSQIGEVIRTGAEDEKVLVNKKPVKVQGPDMSGTIPGWFGLYPKYPEDITDQMRRVDYETNKTKTKEAKREYQRYETAERNLQDARRASDVVTNIEKSVGFDPGSIAKLVDFVKTAATKDVEISRDSVAKDQETVGRIKQEQAQRRNLNNETTTALVNAEQKLNLDTTTLRDAQERLDKIKQMEMIVTEIEVAKFYAKTHAKEEVRSAKRTLTETLRRQAISKVNDDR